MPDRPIAEEYITIKRVKGKAFIQEIENSKETFSPPSEGDH